jgi:16S rRNA (adenine1518-N6/adenine1519-N6)-dimethyltransferase
MGNRMRLTPKEELLAKLQNLGVEPKKALGQNFLISGHVITRILDKLDQLRPEFVVEVGPGLGALTDLLLQRPVRRLLIELDRTYAKHWREKGEHVIEEDALQLNWHELEMPEKTLLLSNLPYNIASRMVIDRALGPQKISTMILMMQKEVAERLMAKPSTPDYGFLTVVAQTFWQMRTVVDASPECFFPIPKVSSRVLSFERIADAQFDEKFIAFVKSAFQFRRKQLSKNLKSKEKALKLLLVEMGYSEVARAEELRPADFQQLFLKL